MKQLYRISMSLLLAVTLAGCAGHSSRHATEALPSSPETKHDVRLEIDQPVFPIKQWKADGSHMTSVKGKLLIDDRPVANGMLHPSNTATHVMTGKDGSFKITLDQSLLSDIKVNVSSLDQATVSGKRLTKDMTKSLQSASATVSVYYPIRITNVEDAPQDDSQVHVHGQVIPGKGDVVSYFQVDKYRMGGVVKDAVGKPVENAVVWFDRDKGEGFGKSTPTDRNGNYSIYYWPEDEDTHLSVTVGTKRYTLPKGRVFRMPEQTSVEIDIMLPKKGTVIDDKPPSLVSVTSAGAMYTGVLVGLNLPKEVPYTATIPDKQGRFVITVSKKIWEQKPAFFETTASKFVEGSLTTGDSLPPHYFQPAEEDPKNITPMM
ncbi:carboxypeptidase-like regulatory domain-containing protein [Paenibacillus sp. VCA1]|uniref:carboxypeptidase-like regulatory domain-containing protein n=1 Tax=Paenibacillus sp. VCA1 TaxID=3039148 RepID=UPI00287175A4|nr:carboxypeptidase-like regulatory domain-containing protein [Paenibacillus sp. VCA1]MDR9854287.1 carboxypeptidase-like regulatory domain-containing protein [Paenibacillus sp. VCA1]